MVHSDDALLFQLPYTCFAESMPPPKRPRISKSVSALMKDSKAKSVPLFTHWFAIEVYNAYLTAQKQLKSQQYPVKIVLDGSMYFIEKSKLENVVEAIGKIVMNYTKRQDIRGCGLRAPTLKVCEATFSCMYARALDRFLFPDERIGACFHQGPTRNNSGTTERADIYIAPLRDFSPMAPVLVSDVKLNELDVAKKETTLYSAESLDAKTFPVLQAIPGTLVKTALQVHVFVDGNILIIPVIESDIDDRALLCSLYAAIQYICCHPLSTKPQDHPMPFKKWECVPLCDNDKREECRVFCRSDKRTVYKLFDTVFDCNSYPNFDLLQKLQLGGLDKQNLTTDERCVMIQYDYIEGDHNPQRLRQFAGVCRKLHKVHTEGYIHGDIREANIIFNDSESDLIDFDLAQGVGGIYPLGYNHFDVRHQDARGGIEMKREHDRHALAKIMESVHDANQHQRIIDMVNGSRTLDSVAIELDSIA